MPLVSMRRSKKDMKEDAGLAVPEPEPYPYGLEIRLDKDELEKLGFTSMPEVGAQLTLIALGKVTSVSQSAGQHGEHQCMSFQITDLQFDKPAKDGQASKSLWGD